MQADSGRVAITNVRIFDGERVLDDSSVTLEGSRIATVGGTVPSDAVVLDGRGGTLMPGLIDAHVHTNVSGLRDALKFGVTTELEMMGHWSARARARIRMRDDVADLRTAEMGVTPKGGHPTQYIASSSNVLLRWFFRFPFVETPDEAVTFVAKQVAAGADYIKIFIEDGSCIGFPGLPVLDDQTLRMAVHEAHRHGKLAIVHATTARGALQAVDAGADGLAHMFLDLPGEDTVARIAASGAFVVPTLVTLSTAFGHSAAALAADERVRARLSDKWLASLARSMNVYPHGRLDHAFATIKALHDAGVDILAGSDVSEPLPMFGGLAHGASLHHELQLLVAAGLPRIDALKAATSAPARRFGLTDRGRIVAGVLADLLLIAGDPLTEMSDTLSLVRVWHRGIELRPQPAPAAVQP
jgi:imidazolonepropionase-like amidohydrolase